MKLAKRTLVPIFLLLAGLWFVLFASDAGNFWHGGTVAGAVLTDAAAALGTLAFVDVVRSNMSKLVKSLLGVLALPLLLYMAFGLFYAAHYVLAA